MAIAKVGKDPMVGSMAIQTREAVDQKDDIAEVHSEIEHRTWETRSSCSLSDLEDEKGGAQQEVVSESKALGELGIRALVLSRGEPMQQTPKDVWRTGSPAVLKAFVPVVFVGTERPVPTGTVMRT